MYKPKSNLLKELYVKGVNVNRDQFRCLKPTKPPKSPKTTLKPSNHPTMEIGHGFRLHPFSTQ